MARATAPLLTALLAVALLAPDASAGAAQTTFTKAQFQQALAEAYGEIWKRNGGVNARDYGSGGQHAMQEFERADAQGAFRVNINRACEFPDSNNSVSYNYNKVQSLSIPAAFINFGDRMYYQFWTQPVSGLYAPYVEKELVKRQKSMQDEFPGGELTISRRDTGQYSIDAARAYGAGLKPNQLRDLMVELMSNSGFALCDIVTHSWLANEKVWDDYKGPITAKVSKELFVALNPLLRKDDYEIVNADFPDGLWQMQGEDWGEVYVNAGDRMDLRVRIKVPKGLSEAQQQALRTALLALPPAKGAARLEVDLMDGYAFVNSIYPYQGMTGKQVMNTVQAFSDDHAETLAKKARAVVKKTL